VRVFSNAFAQAYNFTSIDCPFKLAQVLPRIPSLKHFFRRLIWACEQSCTFPVFVPSPPEPNITFHNMPSVEPSSHWINIFFVWNLRNFLCRQVDATHCVLNDLYFQCEMFTNRTSREFVFVVQQQVASVFARKNWDFPFLLFELKMCQRICIEIIIDWSILLGMWHTQNVFIPTNGYVDANTSASKSTFSRLRNRT
jgi:hypothetical protein